MNRTRWSLSTANYSANGCASRRSRVVSIFAATLLVAAASAGVARAQLLPGIDALGVVPPNPTTSDDIMARIEGMFDFSSQSLEQVLSQRTGDNILVDLLFQEVPTAAPTVPHPYLSEHGLGMLSVGSYELRARTFTSPQFGGTFPDPWPFPEVFPTVVGAGPSDEMVIHFAVVPEPAALVLTATAAGVISVLVRRRG